MNPLQKQTPTKEDEGGGKEEKVQAEEMKAKESNNISCQNNLELRLGVSSSNSSSIFKERMDFSACTDIGLLMTHLIRIHDPKSMHGLDPWLFSDPPTGFIDPWSLAARQQKAVLEQAHKKTTNPSATAPSQDLARGIQPSSPSVVGWPPVCAFRRNMLSSQATRPDAEDERDAKRARIGDGEPFSALVDEAKSSTAMFVKVNMEGYAVGRKIDLKAHSNYDSLSHSLKKMFKNFLSLDYPILEEHIGETLNRDYLLLYEDHEGDRMLVGDVPWEMFLTSVRRLYIVRSPKSQRPATSPANMDAKEYES
ncbi:hypothetical protein IEQ34_018467 [Dendrobium chrysotoxum]|uniref:Auxin-responsive protein n=1 Tax=Dendrobium chrysotoxum TaxID=161865 RepID=A0AAV7G5W7_DENCH|nr:hypothetical protein IEQ34_018467 [Dendrobium chrysotoxum]